MAVSLALWCVAVLIGVAVLAVVICRSRFANAAVYGLCLAATVAGFAVALAHLLRPDDLRVILPVGLPWLGAHFRIDALSAFFLVVVNLGAPPRASTRSAMAATSRRRIACCRSIRPSSPA